jgi:hypothetical protein
VVSPNMKKAKSSAAKRYLKEKFHKMKNEDRPQKQKVAIALSEARQHGYKV